MSYKGINNLEMFGVFAGYDDNLKGQVARLRPLLTSDAERIFQWRRSPEVAENFPSEGTFSWQDHLNWVDRVIGDAWTRYWIIESKEQIPVGLIWLESISKKHSHAEFGFYVGDQGARNSGISSEAEFLMLSYGFKTLGLRKIYCETMAGNVRTINNHRHFGFKVDGVLRRHVRKGNIFHDLVVMSVLDEEFEEIIDRLALIFTSLATR